MAQAAQAPRVTAPAQRSRAACAALIVAALALLWKLGLFLADAAAAIRFPDELDYGEGIVWQQMRLILAGDGYGAIDGFPAIVFHYPPLYHAVTGWAAQAGGFDALAAGRFVSILATLAGAALVGAIAARLVDEDAPRRVRMLCGAAAGLVSLSLFPVMMWAPLMRVDMLGYALGFGGLYLAMRALDRPALIHAAALAFVAALYAKQTMIAPPAAVFLVLLATRPRLAAAGLATALAAGLVALVGLSLTTDGGFARHIFAYNVNRFEPAQLLLIPQTIGLHAIYFGAAMLGMAACTGRLRASLAPGAGLAALRRRVAGDPAAIRLLFVLAHLLFAGLLALTIAKVGSNVNYLIEWLWVISIFAGLAVAPALRAASGTAPQPGRANAGLFAAVVLPAAIGFQALLLPAPPYRALIAERDPAEYRLLTGMIRAADRPVVSDNMVLLLRSGREVVWEPAIFAELASTGVYDERPFVARIREGGFAFFLTFGERGSTRYDQRYTPAVADAIAAAYPRTHRVGNLVVHLPAK